MGVLWSENIVTYHRRSAHNTPHTNFHQLAQIHVLSKRRSVGVCGSNAAARPVDRRVAEETEQPEMESVLDQRKGRNWNLDSGIVDVADCAVMYNLLGGGGFILPCNLWIAANVDVQYRFPGMSSAFSSTTGCGRRFRIPKYEIFVLDLMVCIRFVPWIYHLPPFSHTLFIQFHSLIAIPLFFFHHMSWRKVTSLYHRL